MASVVFAHEAVDGAEEGGEGLARSGGREKKRVVATANDGPGLDLSRGGTRERVPEPRSDGREEAGEGIAREFFALVRFLCPAWGRHGISLREDATRPEGGGG